MIVHYREDHAFENPANRWRSPTEQPMHKLLSLSKSAPIFSKLWHGKPTVVTNLIISKCITEPHYRSLTSHLVDPDRVESWTSRRFSGFAKRAPNQQNKGICTNGTISYKALQTTCCLDTSIFSSSNPPLPRPIGRRRDHSRCRLRAQGWDGHDLRRFPS